MPSLKARLKEIASRLPVEPEPAPIAAVEELPGDSPAEPGLDTLAGQVDTISCGRCGRRLELRQRPELGATERGAWLVQAECNCGEPEWYIREADHEAYLAAQRRRYASNS